MSFPGQIFRQGRLRSLRFYLLSVNEASSINPAAFTSLFCVYTSPKVEYVRNKKWRESSTNHESFSLYSTSILMSFTSLSQQLCVLLMDVLNP